jgi:hypothetical protein
VVTAAAAAAAAALLEIQCWSKKVKWNSLTAKKNSMAVKKGKQCSPPLP